MNIGKYIVFISLKLSCKTVFILSSFYNKQFNMQRIAMLGSGFIGRFYADSLQGQRSKDKIVSIYSRREESAKKFAERLQCAHWTTNMEESIAHPDVRSSLYCTSQ